MKQFVWVIFCPAKSAWKADSVNSAERTFVVVEIAAVVEVTAVVVRKVVVVEVTAVVVGKASVPAVDA